MTDRDIVSSYDLRDRVAKAAQDATDAYWDSRETLPDPARFAAAKRALITLVAQELSARMDQTYGDLSWDD